MLWLYWWILLPICLAFMCIEAVKSPVYGFVLASALLATGLHVAQLFGFGIGHEIDGLAHVLASKINEELLTLALLVAGTTMVANGPGSSVARSLVLRVRNEPLRLTFGMILAGLVGFGNSLTAANLLTQLMPSKGKKTALSLALPAVACTVGCILIPLSPWWVFFKKASGVDLIPTFESLIAPTVFAVSVLLQLLRLQKREATTNDPSDPRLQRAARRNLLRPFPPRLDLGQVLAWASFALPILVVPIVFALRGGKVEEGVLAGVLAGTAASLGVSLLLDLDGDHQLFYAAASTTPKEHLAGPVAVLAQHKGIHLLMPNDRVLGQDSRSQPSALLALIPTGFWQKHELQYARLRAAMAIHLNTWQAGIRSGALAGAIVLACGLLRDYSKHLSDMSGQQLVVGNGTAWAILFTAFAIVAFGGVIGNVLGTAWGTFALVASILSPLIDEGKLSCDSYKQLVFVLMGLLVAVSAGINSFSTQADNVIEVAHDLEVEPAEVGNPAREIVVKALLWAGLVSVIYASVLLQRIKP
ncbi:MAG: hypothetical protein ACOYON_09430 [Fimbriimonas sp.]